MVLWAFLWRFCVLNLVQVQKWSFASGEFLKRKYHRVGAQGLRPLAGPHKTANLVSRDPLRENYRFRAGLGINHLQSSQFLTLELVVNQVLNPRGGG